MVCQRDGAHAGEDEVLCNFIGECLDVDEKDVGGANLLLGLDTPKTDLAVVEGDFVWREGRGERAC